MAACSMANVQSLPVERGGDYGLRDIEKRASRRRKEYFQMDLKGSEAHPRGQVSEALLLVSIAELINPVCADVFVEAGLVSI